MILETDVVSDGLESFATLSLQRRRAFPGMTITYALIRMVTKIAERSVPKARVTELRELIMSDGACSMNV